MHKVILYGHDGCPGSRSARAYFVAEQVAYVYRDIGTDPAACAEFRALGGVATPLIVVGDRQELGFDPDALRDLFEQSPAESWCGSGGDAEDGRRKAELPCAHQRT